MSSQDPKSSAPPPTLEYGHGARLSIIGRHTKKLIFLALCLAIATVAFQNRESLTRRAIWMYWNHLATAHEMPATPMPLRVTPNSAATAGLRLDPGYRWIQTVARSGVPSAPARIYQPEALRQLMDLNPALYDAIGSAGSKTPVIFMGKRRRPDGSPRLVILLGWKAIPGVPTVNLNAVVLPPAGWLSPVPTPRPTVTAVTSYRRDATVENLPEFRTGQADQNDPTHIILRIATPAPSTQASATPQFIEDPNPVDVYLENDDSLRFKFHTDTQFGETVKLEGNPNTRIAAAQAAQRQRASNTILTRNLQRSAAARSPQPATKP